MTCERTKSRVSRTLPCVLVGALALVGVAGGKAQDAGWLKTEDRGLGGGDADTALAIVAGAVGNHF
ncbi:MAG: hypothetical protein AAGC55_09760 [Myxococcota bacterium]